MHISNYTSTETHACLVGYGIKPVKIIIEKHAWILSENIASGLNESYKKREENTGKANHQ